MRIKNNTQLKIKAVDNTADEQNLVLKGNIIMDPVRINDIPKPIKGISCSVTNCQYHDGQAHCIAKNIAVGPSTATACRDTICATFKFKEDQNQQF